MNEQGFVITDGLWEELEPMLLGKKRASGVTVRDYPFISGSVALADQNGFTMARPADVFWELEQRVPPISSRG